MHGRKLCISHITHCPLRKHLQVYSSHRMKVLCGCVVFWCFGVFLKHAKAQEEEWSFKVPPWAPELCNQFHDMPFKLGGSASLRAWSASPAARLFLYCPTEHLQQYWCTCHLLSATKHWDTLPKAFPLANTTLSHKAASSFPQWESKWQTRYHQSHYCCPWIPPNFFMLLLEKLHDLTGVNSLISPNNPR